LLYRLQNSPLRNIGVPRLQAGGRWDWDSTSTLNFVTERTTFVRMYDAQNRGGVLAVDPGVTAALSTAATGVGGLSEAVANDRCYSVHIIATGAGDVFGLWGVRRGTTPALPAGYVWQSPAMCPIIIEGGGNLLDFQDERGGWFSVGAGSISVMVNGVSAVNVAVDLTATPAGPAEVADEAMELVDFEVVVTNAAALQTVTLLERDLPGTGWRALWTQGVANVAGYAQEITYPSWIARINRVNGPADSVGYAWGAGPTGGLDLDLRRVKY
jgi:hypothetical protein